MCKWVRFNNGKMEDEPYFAEKSRGDGFVDTSLFLKRVFRGSRTIISGPRRSGKSTLLSMAKCYFDADLDFRSAFPDSKILTERSESELQMNRNPVIRVDFSDFSAESYEDAVDYYGRKMSMVYRGFIDYLLHPRVFGADCVEKYIHIMDETADREVIFDSLKLLVHQLRYRNCGIEQDRPVVLLDEPYRPEIYARHFGYYDVFAGFMKRFLDIDPYETVNGMIETVYAPPGKEVSYWGTYWGSDSIFEIPELLSIYKQNNNDLELGYRTGELSREDKWSRLSITPEDCFEDVKQTEDINEQECTDRKKEIDVRRILESKRKEVYILQMRNQRLDEERKRNQAEEYALGLPECVKIPSVFAGARSVQLDTKTRNYKELSGLLTRMYREYRKTGETGFIYDMMQGMDEKTRSDFDNEILEELKSYSDSKEEKWKRCDITLDDEYWGRITAERAARDDKDLNDLSLIKTYVSVTDGIHIGKLFSEAIRLLTNKGRNRYHAKISRYKRNDSICFWTSRHDFWLLKNHFDSRREVKTGSLPFVAYKGKLGISREWATWDSHNGRQRVMIEKYFRSLGEADMPDLNDMYDLYLKAWNGMLPDEHVMTNAFKGANAQELIIFLESITAIVNGTELDDDNILLSEDGELWHALGSSKNWYEVGRRLMRDGY